MTDGQVIGLGGIALVSLLLSYFGSTVGLVLGQLRVVLLTYLLGVSTGAPTSLAISTVATVAGAFAHMRGGRVSATLLLTVGLPSSFAAYWGAHHAAHWDARLVKGAIAIVLLFISIRLLRKHHGRDEQPLSELLGSRRFALEVVVGGALGWISGVVGLLLGTIRLPVLLRISGVTPQQAVGTNMAVGALTGLSGGMAALVGGRLHWPAFAVVAPMTLLGAHFGARRTEQIRGNKLQLWVAYALLLSSLLMALEVLVLS